jgi:hypothetical protein
LILLGRFGRLNKCIVMAAHAAYWKTRAASFWSGWPATIPLKELLQISVGIAGALGSLHSRGTVHREIRPSILWLVTGSEKAGMLARLRDGDPSVPAGRGQESALVLTDRAAGGQTGK